MEDKINVVYARVSTRDQSEIEQASVIIKSFSLDNPLILQEEVSAWNYDKEHKRKEFLKLKKLIKARKVKNLYIWDLDRLYRNRQRTKGFFEYAKFYGCSIYSVNQKWLNDFQTLKSQIPANFVFLVDNMYNLLLDVYAQTAEDESNKKSERVKLKVKIGKDGKARSVYGNKWGRKPLPKQTKDRIVELHKQGKSIRQVASEVVQWVNGNQRPISRGAVHKTIVEYSKHKDSFNE